MTLMSMLFVEQDQVMFLRSLFPKEFTIDLVQLIKNLLELSIKLSLKIEIFMWVQLKVILLD